MGGWAPIRPADTSATVDVRFGNLPSAIGNLHFGIPWYNTVIFHKLSPMGCPGMTGLAPGFLASTAVASCFFQDALSTKLMMRGIGSPSSSSRGLQYCIPHFLHLWQAPSLHPLTPNHFVNRGPSAWLNDQHRLHHVTERILRLCRKSIKPLSLPGVLYIFNETQLPVPGAVAVPLAKGFFTFLHPSSSNQLLLSSHLLRH